jgi:hypothetical protein
VLLLALSQGSHPWFDPMNDAATYILVARSLAAGEGYRLLGESFVLRPPFLLRSRPDDTQAPTCGFLLPAVASPVPRCFRVMRLPAPAFAAHRHRLWFALASRPRNQVMSDAAATAPILLGPWSSADGTGAQAP